MFFFLMLRAGTSWLRLGTYIRCSMIVVQKEVPIPVVTVGFEGPVTVTGAPGAQVLSCLLLIVERHSIYSSTVTVGEGARVT